MRANGLTMIIGGDALVADDARPETDSPTEAPAASPARLQQVTDALAAGTAQSRGTGLSVARPSDPNALSARQAAVAAALQEWSGATSGTLRTTALAVLAASRAGKARQEATRAANDPHEETVFEAFVRGVDGPSAALPRTGRGGWR